MARVRGDTVRLGLHPVLSHTCYNTVVARLWSIVRHTEVMVTGVEVFAVSCTYRHL